MSARTTIEARLAGLKERVVQFFIPHAEDSEQAERVYDAIAKFNGAAVSNVRIASLSWRHNGMAMSCSIGEPLPTYYRTGDEPVLAILDCGNVYKVCTPSRGGLRGDAVLAGKSDESHATYFERKT
jgi:hypothetical protein